VPPHVKKHGELWEARLFNPHPPEALKEKRKLRKLEPWEKSADGGDK
jgi:hypothetical protein